MMHHFEKEIKDEAKQQREKEALKTPHEKRIEEKKVNEKTQQEQNKKENEVLKEFPDVAAAKENNKKTDYMRD